LNNQLDSYIKKNGLGDIFNVISVNEFRAMDNEAWRKKYPEVFEYKQNLIDRGDMAPLPSSKIIGNYCVFWNNKEKYNTQISELSMQYCTTDNNTFTKQDPGFTDIDEGDYTFKPDAEILKQNPELAKVDVSKMGYNADVVYQVLNNSVVLKINSSEAFIKGKANIIDIENADVKPFIKDSRTLVPIRFIAEAFGAEVSWDSQNSVITIKSGNSTVNMKISSKEYSVNSEEKLMDVSPEIVNNRTFIPLRALSEALDKEIYWDERGMIVISDVEVENQSSETLNKIYDLINIY